MKRIIVLFLACVMTLSLFACEKDTEAPGTSAVPTSSESPTDVVTASPEASTPTGTTTPSSSAPGASVTPSAPANPSPTMPIPQTQVYTGVIDKYAMRDICDGWRQNFYDCTDHKLQLIDNAGTLSMAVSVSNGIVEFSMTGQATVSGDTVDVVVDVEAPETIFKIKVIPVGCSSAEFWTTERINYYKTDLLRASDIEALIAGEFVEVNRNTLHPYEGVGGGIFSSFNYSRFKAKITSDNRFYFAELWPNTAINEYSHIQINYDGSKYIQSVVLEMLPSTRVVRKRQIERFSDGTIKKELLHCYDLLSDDIEYYSNGQVKKKIEYIRQSIDLSNPDAGKIWQETHYAQTGTCTTKIVYFNNGNMDEEKLWQANGTPIKDATYYYNGNPECVNLYDENGVLIKLTDYDEDGAIGYITEWYSSGILKLEISYVNGIKQEETLYYETGFIKQYSLYNEQGGLLIRENYDADGNPI